MSRTARHLANSVHNVPPAQQGTHSPSTTKEVSDMKSLRAASALSNPSKARHVAVIGAGMAGLRCSTILANAGIMVTLYEARSRLGGRVCQQLTFPTGGHLVDMGPNWIHGTHNNPIMTLAQKTNTAVLDPEERQAIIDSDGERLANDYATELSGKVWGMIVDAFKYSDNHFSEVPSQQSLFDYFWKRLTEDESIDQRKRQDLLHEAQMWGPFVGDAIETQSLKFFWLEECVEGGNVFVAGTYEKILAEVERRLRKSGNVDLRLETEVTRIEHGEKMDKNVVDRAGRQKVRLTTKSGEVSSFDDIVVTCPLGWLKRNQEKVFDPPLPARLQQAISNINYGRLEKLYITFPEAFWLKTSTASTPLSSADSTPPSATFPSTNNSHDLDTDLYPMFTHYHSPTYVVHPQNSSWNQTVLALSHLPSPHAHPTLLFYIYGECGIHLLSLLEGLEPHSPTYNEVLRDFADPFFSKLPNYHPDLSECEPVSYLMTNWQGDDLAGNGSYANFQTGLEAGDEDIECMRDCGRLSSGGNGVWLAGEHTAPFIALGTTTGAWWSGESVARRICARYGVDVVEDEFGMVVDVEEAQKQREVAGLTPQKKMPRKGDMDAANGAGLAI